MRVVSSQQLTLSLEPGLISRWPTLRECVQHTALNDSRGLKAVAADCDLSVSELSRKLSRKNPNDPRSLDVDEFVEILASTGDHTPIRWLIARFLPDDSHRQTAAVQKLERLMSEVAATLSEVKGSGNERGTRKVGK